MDWTEAYKSLEKETCLFPIPWRLGGGDITVAITSLISPSFLSSPSQNHFPIKGPSARRAQTSSFQVVKVDTVKIEEKGGGAVGPKR